MLEKVAVLYGGTSSERDVSLKSGKAVLKALLEQGVNAHGIDTKDYNITALKKDGFTCAFIALHGRGGEDGITQAILEYQEIPYTGSHVLASALAMDKLKTKQIWASLGLPTADYAILNFGQKIDANKLIEKLGLPLFIKPSREGSSVGMSKAHNKDELITAVQNAFKYDDTVIVETFLSGEEYTIPIVGDKALPVIKIKPNATFYDYEAKYLSNSTQYFCPSGLSKADESNLQQLALNAYKAVGCCGWGRVDVMFDSQNKPHLLEVNTAPGMTDHSLVPMAAKEMSISFEKLVLDILSLACY